MKWKYKQQICVGVTPEGKRIRKWAYGNTLNEFNDSISALKNEFKSIRNPSDITFKDYANKWFDTYKSNNELNTRNGYKYAIEKCNAIARVKVRELCKSDLQSIINKNADKPPTCRKIALTLGQIFESAVEDGIIASSPARNLSVPKSKAKEKRALTAVEREAIKTAKLSDQDRFFLDLLYYCGLRRGEALAVTLSDFDFKKLTLTVCKSVAYDKETPILKATKTNKSRYVPIPKGKKKAWQEFLAKAPFSVFSRGGKLLTRTVYRGMWRRIEKAVNVQLGAKNDLRILHITPHMIRHDYSTRLYYVPGISTKKKAEILGHSEQLFLSLYSHLDSEKEDMKTFQKAMNF